MSKVFVSHSSDERQIVESRIISPLEERGIETWYSADQIPGGKEWQDSIRDALNRCEWFLVALSPSSVASSWVKAEVKLAFEKFPRGRILPVIIERCDPSDCHLQLPLLQHIDFLSDEEKGRKQLLDLLGEEHDQRPGPSSKGEESQALIEQLRVIRDQRDTGQMPLVFRSLKHPDEEVRTRAQQAIHKIGWADVSRAIEKLARETNTEAIESILTGLAALEAHPRAVALLNRLIDILGGSCVIAPFAWSSTSA